MKRTNLALALVAFASALSLSACGTKSNDSKPAEAPASGGGRSGGTDPQQAPKDVTPVGQCAYGAPARSLDGRWQFDLQQGEFTFHMIFDFQRGYLNVTNNCELRGHSLAVTVGAPYVDNNRHVTIMGDANDSQSSSEGGVNLECSAAIKRARMTYSFSGSCLQMQAEGESQMLTLLPATY